MRASNHIKKPRLMTNDIPEEIKLKVVEDFRFSKQNSTSELASKYNLSYSRIDTLINQYLNSLKR
jgi:membrane-anchored protein YejM (alkaline phosphatase superfamily)